LALQVHSVLAGVGGSVVVVELVVVVTATVVVVAWAPTRRAHSATRRTTMLRVRIRRAAAGASVVPAARSRGRGHLEKRSRNPAGSGVTACYPLPIALTRFSPGRRWLWQYSTSRRGNSLTTSRPAPGTTLAPLRHRRASTCIGIVAASTVTRLTRRGDIHEKAHHGRWIGGAVARSGHGTFVGPGQVLQGLQEGAPHGLPNPQDVVREARRGLQASVPGSRRGNPHRVAARHEPDAADLLAFGRVPELTSPPDAALDADRAADRRHAVRRRRGNVDGVRARRRFQCGELAVEESRRHVVLASVVQAIPDHSRGGRPGDQNHPRPPPPPHRPIRPLPAPAPHPGRATP